MLSQDLQRIVESFTEGTITIDQLEDWIVPRLPAALQLPDTTDAQIISAIELSLAEYNQQILTASELRNLLRTAVRQEDTVLVPSIESTTSATSASQTLRQRSISVSTLTPAVQIWYR